MKRTIRLNESELKRMISESVKRILREGMVDRDGNPYIEDESFPAGGGLDDRCSYNNECIKAFDMMSSEKIEDFLESRGFELIDEDYYWQIWQKGDTRVTFDGYEGGCYGYMTTEYCG